MAKFNDSQANSAYQSVDVVKYTNDSDPTKCLWNFSLTFEGNTYAVIQVDEGTLPIDSTPVQVKNWYVDNLKTEVDYIDAQVEYSIESVAKV